MKTTLICLAVIILLLLYPIAAFAQTPTPPATEWRYDAPSGGVMVVEERATFGDLLVGALLVLLLGVEIVALVKRQR
jgi:hypothetical protein